jgi:hypothetical protein
VNLGEFEMISRYPGWQFFGTLTWAKDPKDREARALGGAVQFFGRTAQLVGVPFSYLVWCLRGERGERFGRGHHHYLLGGMHKLPATLTGASTLRWLWESAGHGFADVKVFDRARRGPAYVLDCLSGAATRGGANYESRKFAFVEDRPMLSASLLRWHRRFEREFLTSEKRRRRWLYESNKSNTAPGHA